MKLNFILHFVQEVEVVMGVTKEVDMEVVMGVEIMEVEAVVEVMGVTKATEVVDTVVAVEGAMEGAVVMEV